MHKPPLTGVGQGAHTWAVQRMWDGEEAMFMQQVCVSGV